MKERSEIKSIILKADSPLKAGLDLLNRPGNNFPIIIVDENYRLLNTLTDQDCRLSLLSGLRLDDPINRVIANEPHVMTVYSTYAERQSYMRSKEVNVLPIVDGNGVLVGAEMISNMDARRKPINEAVVMCGGLGCRLGKLTRDCPKPMLKIGNMPILEIILKHLISSGISKFFFATNYLREKIENYFEDGGKYGVEIRYLHEDKRLGTGGALSLLPYIPDQPLIVMNGDLLTDFNLRHLIDFHTAKKNAATMAIVEHSYKNRYGVIRHEDHLLTAIEEKPLHHYFINAGIYIIEPEIIKNVPRDTYIDMPSILLKEKNIGKNVNVYPLYERWLDIGHENDYQAAQAQYQKR